jgi:hypothetical protein
MEGSTTRGVEAGDFSEVCMVLDCIPQKQLLASRKSEQYDLSGNTPRWEKGGRTFCSEEFARYVEGFAANDYYLLAIEQLFRDSAGQATKQVSFAVNDNLVITS